MWDICGISAPLIDVDAEFTSFGSHFLSSHVASGLVFLYEQNLSLLLIDSQMCSRCLSLQSKEIQSLTALFVLPISSDNLNPIFCKRVELK